MKSRKIGAFIAVIVCCVGCSACSTRLEANPGAPERSTPVSRDFATKAAALTELPATHANALKLERLIKKGEGGSFVYPSSLVSSKSKDGQVLIADNNGHSIHYCPPNTLATTRLPIPNGEGDLRFPTTIREAGGRIFVADDDGIKVFSENGQYERLLRTYYAVFNFAIAQDGSIYANASHKTPKDSDRLIVKLGAKGERISSFGRRLNHLQYKGMDDWAFLACSGQLLFAGFKHRPLVEVYDLRKEMLLREIAVTHPAFGRLESLAQDQTFTNPSPSKTALPRYIAGISVVGDRVFVLLHLPHVEIIEFDFEGHEKNRFRSLEVSNVLDYFGLDARQAEGTNVFYVGIAGVLGQREFPFFTEFKAVKAE